MVEVSTRNPGTIKDIYSVEDTLTYFTLLKFHTKQKIILQKLSIFSVFVACLQCQEIKSVTISNGRSYQTMADVSTRNPKTITDIYGFEDTLTYFTVIKISYKKKYIIRKLSIFSVFVACLLTVSRNKKCHNKRSELPNHGRS